MDAKARATYQQICSFKHTTMTMHILKPDVNIILESKNGLPKIRKNLYTEAEEVARLKEEEVYKLRDGIIVTRLENTVTTEKMYIPNPIQTLEQIFGAHSRILTKVKNIKQIYPLQSQSWPILLNGQDLLSIVNTRAGKTLSFLLPALIHIGKQPTPIKKRKGPNVLIVAPTRESVQYIQQEVIKYSNCTLKSSCLFSGIHIDEQIEETRQGVQIVIATPCTLNRLFRVISLDSITYLVFDDADRMLEMGFGRAIRESLMNVMPHIQAIVTSSSLQYPVQLLSQQFLKNPVQLVMKNINLKSVRPIKYEFTFFKTGDRAEKLPHLLKYIKTLKGKQKIIVYTRSKISAVSISAYLFDNNINCQSIFYNVDQGERDQALEDMWSGNIKVLITTDSESPYIDIDQITCVVNFELPVYINYMVSRIGRIGCPGQVGYSQIYISPSDWNHAIDVIDLLLDVNQEVPIELSKMAKDHKQYLRKTKKYQSRKIGCIKWGPKGNIEENYGDCFIHEDDLRAQFNDEGIYGDQHSGEEDCRSGSSESNISKSNGKGKNNCQLAIAKGGGSSKGREANKYNRLVNNEAKGKGCGNINAKGKK